MRRDPALKALCILLYSFLELFDIILMDFAFRLRPIIVELFARIALSHRFPKLRFHAHVTHYGLPNPPDGPRQSE